MKTLTIITLTVATIVLGVWCANRQGKIKSLSVQLAQTETQLAAVKAELQKEGEAIEHAKYAAANEKILQQILTETEAGAAE